MTHSVIDFTEAAEKHRQQREWQEQDAQMALMRERFAKALPEKARPVKAYMAKKRAKKKR